MATFMPDLTEENSTGRAWGWGLFVFFFAFCLHFAGTWALPLIDRDEPRFAEATREMRARQDWIIPHLNNQYRFDKPPLTYWMQALSCDAFGESDWAVRLPSVLASALTSLILFIWGRQVVGERTGLWAGIIFATALQVLIHSKLAVADLLMVLMVTVTAWSGWNILRNKKAGGVVLLWKALFVFGLALGFLAKGPIAWMPLGMVAIVCFRFSRSPSPRPSPPGEGESQAGFLKRRTKESGSEVQCANSVGKSLAEIGLMAVLSAGLVLVWAVPALKSTHGEYFRSGIGEHVVARGLVSFEGHGGGGILAYLALLPFYFVTIFPSFFPWSIALPWLARQLWKRENRDELEVYLISGIALVFGIFTFYRTRLPHYTLPAFPMLSLLLAREWSRAHRSSFFLRCGAIGMAVAGLAIAFFGFPMLRKMSPAPQLASLSAPALKPEMEFAATGFNEPSLIWYFRAKVHGYFYDLPPEAIKEFMAKPGPRFCIMPASAAEELFPVLPENCRVLADVEGINVVKAARVRVRMIVKEN